MSENTFRQRKGIVTLAAVVMFALVANACAPATAHRVAGITLQELGQQFLTTAAMYDQAFKDGTVSREEYAKFAAFATSFQELYERAHKAWLDGSDPTDALIRLKNELLVYALRLRK